MIEFFMTYIGFFAAFCTTIAFLPQAIKVYKTKSTKDISLYMFLIFTIGSSNIFPSGDLGFVKAISKHYKRDLPISEKFLSKLFKRWSPYSSIATWYLWRSLDPIPVSY